MDPSLSRPCLPNAVDRNGLLHYPRMRRVYEFSNLDDPSVIGWQVAASGLSPQQFYFPSVWVDVT